MAVVASADLYFCLHLLREVTRTRRLGSNGEADFVFPQLLAFRRQTDVTVNCLNMPMLAPLDTENMLHTGRATIYMSPKP